MTRKRLGISLTIVVLLAVGGILLVSGGGMAKLLGRGETARAAAAAAADDSLRTATADSSVAEAKDAKDAEPAVPVELALVERRRIAAYYKAASTVEADRLVDLVSKTTGRVRKLNVDEGDWVKKGDILVELENDRERVQLRQAELKLDDEKRKLDRNQSMRDQNLISDQEFDLVKSAEELAETERDLAAIALEDTRIRAPFDGQITRRSVVLGQQVVPSAVLLTLGDFDPMRVRVHLPEAVARKVKAGQRVLINPEAVDHDIEAVVERVAPVVDPATSTVRLTLLLSGDGADLVRAGGFVKARITTDTHNDALAVPKPALVEEGGMRSVFVAEADTVRKVEINTGLYDEQYVEVLDGLEPGAFVVTAGQGGLRTGARIDPLNAVAVGWKKPDASLAPSQPHDTQVARAGGR